MNKLSSPIASRRTGGFFSRMAVYSGGVWMYCNGSWPMPVNRNVPNIARTTAAEASASLLVMHGNAGNSRVFEGELDKRFMAGRVLVFRWWKRRHDAAGSCAD